MIVSIITVILLPILAIYCYYIVRMTARCSRYFASASWIEMSNISCFSTYFWNETIKNYRAFFTFITARLEMPSTPVFSKYFWSKIKTSFIYMIVTSANICAIAATAISNLISNKSSNLAIFQRHNSHPICVLMYLLIPLNNN